MASTSRGSSRSSRSSSRQRCAGTAHRGHTAERRRTACKHGVRTTARAVTHTQHVPWGASARKGCRRKGSHAPNEDTMSVCGGMCPRSMTSAWRDR
eukprot:7032170-Prymnesium_polylepis.1